MQNAMDDKGCYYRAVGEEVVSALYLLPVDYRGTPGYYLYAAATHPAFRGRGLMRRLIAQALSGARAEGAQFVYLCPCEPSLYRFYEPLGFTQTLYALFSDTMERDWTSDPDKMHALARGSGIAPVFASGVYRFASDAGCRVCDGPGCEFGGQAVFPFNAGVHGVPAPYGMLAPLHNNASFDGFFPFLTMN